VLTETEQKRLKRKLLTLRAPVARAALLDNVTVCGDLFQILPWLPGKFVDLLFLDPPYNLTKTFHGSTHRVMPAEQYGAWFESWLVPLLKTLKPTASVYVCGDWRSSAAIFDVLNRHLIVRNRITWEREKGRGAKANFKNCAEDIWFCTVSKDYTFNVDAVKLKRKVIAPYTDDRGEPKDWTQSAQGNHRLTHPSNLWTDLTVPFWSMPENTDHPTQKPEKLLAKILLASTNPGDLVFDPFLGSGTTSVVAKKLGRRYCGIEMDALYCSLAEKRLELAESDPTIQGYENGVFLERNA
jgi:site-specific DNA-methyltransferase (adenine-specific)